MWASLCRSARCCSDGLGNVPVPKKKTDKPTVAVPHCKDENPERRRAYRVFRRGWWIPLLDIGSLCPDDDPHGHPSYTVDKKRRLLRMYMRNSRTVFGRFTW